MSDIFSLGLSELAQGLRDKTFSSRELIETVLSRVHSSSLNAFTEVLSDSARADAEKADKRIQSGESLPLLGVPVAVKDNILAEGSKSTCGSNFLRNFVSPYDATVISKLRAAGAVIVAKTNLDEFCMGSSSETSCFGPVKNPWDASRVPGGTSGGSTAAVAAELIPAALGSDTGGSIRQPASFCNVTGIKPTYGRVSRYGVIAYASSLDQVGTIARNAEDAALLLQVISGKDSLDATSVDTSVPDFVKAALQGSKEKTLTGLRVGVPKEYFIAGLNQEVEKAIRAAIAHLEKLGAKAVPISLPHTEAAIAAYYVIAPAEASSNLARYDGVRYGTRAKDTKDLKELYLQSRSEGFGAEVKRRILIGTYVLSTGYYDAYYRQAQKTRTLVAQDFKRAFGESCDVIACPAAPTTAFKIGEKVNDPIAMYLEDAFTIPASLAGLPGISIPCGFDTNHLPIGLQLIAPAWNEELLLRMAGAFQATTTWHSQRPKVQ